MSEKHSIDVEKEAENNTVIPGISEDAIRSGSVVPAQILKHSHDADEAMKAFLNHKGEVLHIDEATNKRLLRRIDLHLMPLLCLVYGLNYLDKTTLSYASIMGISLPKEKGGIGLRGDQYNWLGSMFYFGYLAWEYPTNRSVSLPYASQTKKKNQ
jgi:ACS family allantoate permease-like MFS transporter